METILIVNITQSAFFRYSKKQESDTNYNKILLELLTPPPDTLLSHWDRRDRIVFAPINTHEYVERNFCELHL
jgi:hypothetical protein